MHYRIYLRSCSGAILGRDDFECRDDSAALRVASMIFDACSDVCHCSELWQSQRLVRPVAEQAPAIDGEIARIVLEVGERLKRSQWAVAQSERLTRQGAAYSAGPSTEPVLGPLCVRPDGSDPFSAFKLPAINRLRGIDVWRRF